MVSITKTALPAQKEGTRSLSGKASPVWLWASGWIVVLWLMLLVDGPAAIALRSASRREVLVAALLSNVNVGYVAMAVSLLAGVLFWCLARLSQGESRARWRRRFATALFMFGGPAAALLVTSLLKALIGRSRPVLMATEGPLSFHPFSAKEAWTSFPSGETTLMVGLLVALMLVVAPSWGRGRAALLMIPAVVVASGRVLSGAHYVSDVLAGTLIAFAVVTWLHATIVRRLA